MCGLQSPWCLPGAQVLAAEKAGSWSAALTLYEQCLKNEAAAAASPTASTGSARTGGPAGQLGGVRRGHLNCLLQLGHLENLLIVVDGWSSRCTGAAPPSQIHQSVPFKRHSD
jgi:hypothetical protein